jgi:FtsH-binding integral membrane protein
MKCLVALTATPSEEVSGLTSALSVAATCLAAWLLVLSARRSTWPELGKACTALATGCAGLLVAGFFNYVTSWSVGLAALSFIAAVLATGMTWVRVRRLADYAAGPPKPDGSPSWWDEFERDFRRHERERVERRLS